MQAGAPYLVAAEGKGLGVVTLYIKPRAADIRLDI
jgi:hypothetical protein